MENSKAKAFMFYESYCDSIWSLGRKNRLELYDAITKYAIRGEEIELGHLTSVLFSVIKPTIKSSLKNYKKVTDKFNVIKDYQAKKSKQKKCAVSLNEKEKEKEKEKENEKEKEIVCGEDTRKNAKQVGGQNKYASRYDSSGHRREDWEMRSLRNDIDWNSMFDSIEDIDL